MIALLFAGLAGAAEFRRLDLVDGRRLTVEVLGSEATGLIVRTPQGTMHLPYEQIGTIVPAEPGAFEAQRPLRVLVLPFAATAPATSDDAGRLQGLAWHELQGLPALELYTIGQMAGYAPATTAEALSRCGADLGCIRARISPYDVDLVVSGTVSGDARDELALVAVWAPYPEAGRVGNAVVGGAPEAQRLAVQKGIYGALGLDVPPPPQVAAVPEPVPEPIVAPVPVEPMPRTRRVSPALAAVPLPGITAFAAGDVRHGLAATAITVPATVGIVYLAGSSSTRPEEVIGLSVLGWWALCAATNVAWMPTVTPTEGGAKVQVGGSF